MLELLLTLVGLSAKSLGGRPVLLDAAGDRYASEFVLVGTGTGLYAFDRNAGTWQHTAAGTGLPGSSAELLALDDGVLWVGTDSGLAAADLRANDWVSHPEPGHVNGVAFDEDYVWAAADSAVWRFDRYLEQWEPAVAVRANDVESRGDFLWLASDSGVFRCSKQYRTLERQPVTAAAFTHIFSSGSRTWFLGPGLRASLEPEQERWTEFPGSAIADFAGLGESLFVLGPAGVELFDPKVGTFAPLREAEATQQGIAASGNRLLLVSADGITALDVTDLSRTGYTRGSGLTLDSVLDGLEDSRLLFVVGSGGVQWTEKGSGIWQTQEFSRPRRAAARLFDLDEQGAHARVIPNTDVRLAGRAYYSTSGSLASGSLTRTQYENVNLNLAVEHSSGRKANGFYDDSDKEQVTWGLGYRGLGSDALARANAGFLSAEYFEFGLVPGFATLGGNARLKLGRHALDAQAGRLQSSVRQDWFFGRKTEHDDTVPDLAYRSRAFFRAPEVRGRENTRGQDTVFRDDRVAGNNEAGTRPGFEAGGMTGDFDVQVQGQDYFIDYGRGIVQLLSPARAGDRVVLRLPGEDVVLQSETESGRALENVYSFGTGIVPGTFELSIVDTLGDAHPLDEFGLDQDQDGRVDDAYLNADLGLLEFPDERPFPAPVYEDSLHVFALAARFSTRTASFVTGTRPVVKGSEQVLVDGEELVQGTDYVIDYTAGRVVFLRDDAVSDLSAVEVRYASVERDRRDLLWSGQANVEVAPGVNVAPGFSSVADARLGHLSGKLERQFGQEGLVRIVPQVAMTPSRQLAQDHSAVLRYRWLGLSARYRGFGRGFDGFGRDQARYGRLEHGVETGLTVEPVQYARFDAGVDWQRQEDSVGRPVTTRRVDAGARYQNPRLPQFVLSAASEELPDYRKVGVRSGLDYDFTALASSARLAGTVRAERLVRGTETEPLLEYSASANIGLPIPVRLDGYFRHNDLGAGEKQEDELRCHLSVDAVPGLYYTGSLEQEAVSYRLTGTRDLDLGNRFSNNLGIAPGRWWSGLSIVNLQLGTGSSFDEYCRGTGRRPFVAFTPVTEGIASINSQNSVYGTVQLQPVSALSVWYRRTMNQSGTSRYGLAALRPGNEDKVRVEFEPARFGKLVADASLLRSGQFPLSSRRNVYTEWSMPWTDRFRTRLLGNWNDQRYDFRPAVERQAETRLTCEGVLRFGSKSHVLASVGAGRSEESGTGDSYSFLPGAGVNLNLLKFLYLQFDYTSTVPFAGAATHNFSGRLTAQF